MAKHKSSTSSIRASLEYQQNPTSPQPVHVLSSRLCLRLDGQETSLSAHFQRARKIAWDRCKRNQLAPTWLGTVQCAPHEFARQANPGELAALPSKPEQQQYALEDALASVSRAAARFSPLALPYILVRFRTLQSQSSPVHLHLRQ